MSKYICATICLLAFFNLASATDHEQQQQVLTAVVKMLTARHYHPKPINDAFSREIWNAYLTQLDPDKRFFLQTDSAALDQYATTLDDEMNGTNPISFLPTVLPIFKQRVEEVSTLYHQLLKSPLHLSGKNEVLERNTVYPADAAARQHYAARYLQFLVVKNSWLIQARHKGITPTQLDAQARALTLQQLERGFSTLQTNLDEDKQFISWVNVIVHTMDPHTDYFPPQDQQGFYDMMRNRFIGIGVQLQQEDGIIKIVGLEPGGPAWKSGQIQPNDYILQVGEGDSSALVDITGMSQAEVSKLIRGAKGTTVKLELRKTDGSITTIPLIRDEIIQEEGFARSAIIQQGAQRTGYIMLPKFYIDATGKTDVHCATDIAHALTALKAANVNSIVLDLRNNGGGSLEEVIRMVGLFIKSGPVVQVKDNAGNILVLKDRDTSLLYDGPLVVMVNEMSASAAEIFAAAMQDYRRGIIIGSSTTYGKGTVQGNFNLGETIAGGLKLTYQQFYRVNGSSTQLKGVIPDIILPDTYDHLKVREKDIPTALPWNNIPPATYTPWENNTALIQQASKRVATDSVFNALGTISTLLADTEYNQRLLNPAAYAAQQAVHKKTQQQVQQLQRLPQGRELNVLPLNSDSENYLQWLQKLKTDIYIDEAVKVAGGLQK